jgi:type IV pilus assembly protein PilC
MEYSYQGITRANKSVKGVIEARDEVEARMLLREQQIRPIRLNKRGGMSLNMDVGDLFGNVKFLQPSVGLKDLVMMTRQLSVMIDAGIPQVMALDILAKQSENPALRKVVQDVKDRVEQGSAFNAALGRHPKIFSQLYTNLVAAGEQGGVLDVILRRLADYLEKTSALIGKVKSAMFYPAAVVVVAVLVVWGLLTFVVPKFAEFVKSMGGNLPAPTLMLIDISHFFVDRWYVIFASILGIIFGVRALFVTPSTRKVIDRVSLRIPVIGPIVRKTAVSRFARTMSILLQSGVPILESMDICGRIAGNYTVQEALQKTKIAVAEGKSMAAPLEYSGVFPPMVVQMVSVGEKTGALDQMLAKVADFYDEQVDASIKGLTSLLEPVMMVVLGTIVGGILIALYLPIFKLAGTIGG